MEAVSYNEVNELFESYGFEHVENENTQDLGNLMPKYCKVSMFIEPKNHVGICVIFDENDCVSFVHYDRMCVSATKLFMYSDEKGRVLDVIVGKWLVSQLYVDGGK